MRRYDVIAEICDYMLELGWGPYQNDHEDANGQFEMNWNFDDCLVTADRHSFFKFMVKSIAEKHGLRATFMPKPFPGLTGNGCHAHISVWDKDGRTNMFFDDADEMGLSQQGYNFLGGIMKHAEALAAITNPTVNSYKRINAPRTVSGATWSPNTVTWTGNNRTHMVRVPGKGRFELRLPDGAANPYLLQAVIIAAGLDGIATKADPGQALRHRHVPARPYGEGRAEAAAEPARRAARFRQGQEPQGGARRGVLGRLPQAEAPGMECLRLALHAVGARQHARRVRQQGRNSNRSRRLPHPSPLRGRVRGGGDDTDDDRATPTLDPSPQGGRGASTSRVARMDEPGRRLERRSRGAMTTLIDGNVHAAQAAREDESARRSLRRPPWPQARGSTSSSSATIRPAAPM